MLECQMPSENADHQPPEIATSKSTSGLRFHLTTDVQNLNPGGARSVPSIGSDGSVFLLHSRAPMTANNNLIITITAKIVIKNDFVVMVNGITACGMEKYVVARVKGAMN